MGVKRIRPKRTPEQNRRYEENRKAKLASLSAEDLETRRKQQVEYDRKYYERNKIKILKRKKQYHVENKQEIIAKKMQYAQLNRERVNQHSAACNHRRRASTGYLTTGDIRKIKESSDGLCCYCLKSLELMELEHCTPLSRNGFHDESNCAYACRNCNRTKSDKTVLEFLFGWVRVTDTYSSII